MGFYGVFELFGPADESMSQSVLIDFLIGLQDRLGGVIPVDRFMREALYHPEFGYYSSNIRTVGRRGDFATSASLGTILGEAVAGWILRQVADGSGRDVIEVGAGSGAMARTVLGALGFWNRLKIKYHIVETSPVLRAEQQAALKGKRVSWHDSMDAALDAVSGRAMILSNELIDAFPCRVFERRDGVWCEVAIRIDGTSLAEVLIASELPPAASALGLEFAEGQRVEVHAAAGEWMASWSPRAHHVEMLTIDYGGPIEKLYYRRPRGTLRAYFHQQRFDGPSVFHRFGKQDITADVNFTDLQSWGEFLGWETRWMMTQGGFIGEFASRAKMIKIPADVALADLSGVGSAFQVLHQSIRRAG